jgi:DNA polymerase III delta prime subunit
MAKKAVKGASGGGTILVGTAKAGINPPADVKFVTYRFEQPYTGVESDFFVRAAVFGDPATGKPVAALAVIDTLYAHNDITAEIRKRAAAAVPGLAPDKIMVASTHTHSAPPLHPFDASQGGWPGRFAVDYRPREGRAILEPLPNHVQNVVAAGAAAIAAAWKDRAEVKARAGQGEAWLGHSRRVVGPDGKATNEWTDPEGKHTGYFDPRVRFIVFEDAAGGKVRAILAGYGCHPVTIGPGSSKPSPDFPGHFVRALEAATGCSTAIHITTGGGDANPRVGLSATPEPAAQMGQALAKAVLDALPGAQPLNLSPVAAARVSVEFGLRKEMGLGPRELVGSRPEAAAGKVVTEVQAIRLGDLALVSAPGELFAALGVAVEKISPAPRTIAVGHANDAIGYIYPEAAFAEGGYEVIHGAASDSMEKPYLEAAAKALRATMEK